MTPNKIKSLSTLKSIIRKLQDRGKRVVFTNGCFDILHSGHVSYLEKARCLGDFLVVGLNSDRSVRYLKGRGRPVNHWKDRARVLAALSCIDFVVGFDEATPLALINKIRPRILVKGSDWSAKDIVGAREVKSWGGCVRRVPLLKGRSTTKTLRRLLRRRKT